MQMLLLLKYFKKTLTLLFNPCNILHMANTLKKLSLRKLAKTFDVSYATVLRSLRNEDCVRPELKAEIQEYARKHRYEPNVLAKGVFGGKTQTVAVLIPRIDSFVAAANISGAQSVLHDNDYRCLLLTSNNDYKQEFEQIRQAAMCRVDGMLLMACEDAADKGHFEELQIRGIPVVLMSRAVCNVPFDIFTGADKKDGYIMTQNLIDLGHRRIFNCAFAPKGSLGWLRTAGYADAMKDNGLYDESLLWPAETSLDDMLNRLSDQLESSNSPTAIILGTENMVSDVYNLLMSKKLTPGKDVSVAAFLSGHAGNPYRKIFPKVGGIVSESYENGRQAASKLLQIINNTVEKHEPRVVEIPGRWELGDSIFEVKSKLTVY